MPFCSYFSGTGKGTEVDFDNLLPDLDLLDDGLDDGPLLIGRQLWPAVVQVARLDQDLVPSDVLDFEEVELTLKSRQLLFHSLETLFKRSVRPPESLRRDLVGDVQAVGLVHLLPDLGRLCLQGNEPLLLGPDLLVGLPEMPGHVLRRKEEVLELLVEHCLQVPDRDLRVAAVADVFRHVRGHVHLVSALAEHVAGEEMDGFAGGALRLVPALIEDGHALRPELLGHDRLDRGEDPVLPRLELPLLPLPKRLGVVGPARALRDRISDEPVDRRVRELPPAPGPVPLLVEESGDGLLPLVLEEELVHELSDWRLFRVRDELVVLPLVPVGSGSACGLAELRANRY